jgi:hypothetical protein
MILKKSGIFLFENMLEQIYLLGKTVGLQE